MAKQKRTYWIHNRLVKLAQEKAEDLERSEAFIVELSLREMFRNQLPQNWKPGKDGGESES